MIAVQYNAQLSTAMYDLRLEDQMIEMKYRSITNINSEI
jgi:hypothetical protein